MSLLRLWFLVTAGIILGALTWSFAPILIPVFLVGGGLGLLVLVVTAAARWIEALRRPAGPGSDTSGPDMQPKP